MRLSERPPAVRHRRERFPYDQMFNGQAWRVTKKDYKGRSQVQAYNLIRQAAWRRKLDIAIEFDDGELIVQVKTGEAV